MRNAQSLTAALFAASILSAQAPTPNASDQPDTQTLSAAVRALRRTAQVSDEIKAQADRLIAEAGPGRGGGDSRRKLANALVLLEGDSWDETQEYAWSLALRPDQNVADSSLPFIARLSQIYSASLRTVNALRVRLFLLQEDGKPVRQIGAYDLPSRDLIEQPFGMDADLDGVSDGSYTLHAEVLDRENPVAAVSAPFQLVKGIALDRASVERRLAHISGHDSAKASVRYPYVLAETVNVGRRQLTGADFGLPFQPQPPFDFVKGVQYSADLLKSLEAGKDPLYRAKGDHERHYWFEEAHEMMAYHVYVPLRWDGKSKLPMVLVLHGNTRDQDYYFDRDDHILSKEAEKHGYLVVCPMGYRPSAGWGSNSLNRLSAGAAGSGRGGFAADPARSKQGDLSEKDALNVLDLITKEYPIDTSRIYLFGHSAGGAGTWYLGEKHAEKWAAIAASAAATRPEGFPFGRLKGMPIMVCHGDKDDEVPIARSRDMVKAAKENGLDPVYVEEPGATHLTIVAIVEPKVFDFFDQHSRKQ